MIKTIDIAWLGGLLEGEGYFALQNKTCPMIRLGMTDEDTVIKAATLMGSSVYRHRNVWITRIGGLRAIQWMFMLYPFLGKRRRIMVTSIIKYWKGTIYMRASRGTRNRATCHPNRLSEAFGMCGACYQRKRRERKLLKKVG